MRYFKTTTTVENGKIKYGNLPVDFVVGYVDGEVGFFALHPEVALPENHGLTEITEKEYNELLNALREKEVAEHIAQTQAALEVMRAAKEAKEAELEALKNVNADLKARLETTEETLLKIMFGNV